LLQDAPPLRRETDQDRTSRAFLIGYTGVLIGCFSPFKMLAYMLPALFVGWMALYGGVDRRRAGQVALVIVAMGVLYFIVEEEFLVTNYLVACVTYSAFLPLLLVDSSKITSSTLFERIIRITAMMVAVQGVVGIAQACYGVTQTGAFGSSNGDYVQGTIYPHFDAERAFSNPMFATNMAIMLLACLAMPTLFTGTRRIILVLGATALVLASVLHVLLLLAGSLAVSFLLVRRERRTKGSTRGLLAMLAFAALLTYVALPDNVANISKTAEHMYDIDNDKIPRAILLARVFYQLPDDAPPQPYIGLGPGQFSSRASLIMSGLYLGGPTHPKPLPVEPASTRLAADYCISLWVAIYEYLEDAEVGRGGSIGSTQQPFFSWLSVYTETGVAGLLLCIVAMIWIIVSVRRATRQNPESRSAALLIVGGALLVFLLGMQDNYWEAPQALLVGLLLLKVMHARLTRGPSSADAAAQLR
jgi:hypothetical protein